MTVDMTIRVQIDLDEEGVGDPAPGDPDADARNCHLQIESLSHSTGQHARQPNENHQTTQKHRTASARE